MVALNVATGHSIVGVGGFEQGISPNVRFVHVSVDLQTFIPSDGGGWRLIALTGSNADIVIPCVRSPSLNIWVRHRVRRFAFTGRYKISWVLQFHFW